MVAEAAVELEVSVLIEVAELLVVVLGLLVEARESEELLVLLRGLFALTDERVLDSDRAW